MSEYTNTTRITAYRIDETGVNAASGRKLYFSNPYPNREDEPAERSVVAVDVIVPDWLVPHEILNCGGLDFTTRDREHVGAVYYPDQNKILVNTGDPRKEYTIHTTSGEIVHA